MKSGVYLSPDGKDLMVYSVDVKSCRPHIIILEGGHHYLSNKWAVEVVFKDWHFLGDL